MSVSQRQRLGIWYTPAPLVSAIADELVALLGAGTPLAGRTVRVLDPACGDGRFVVAVGDRLLAAGARPLLTGVDIDPGAPVFGGTVDAEVVHADALAIDWRARRFDVVVGNPPFLSQLATATSRGGRSRFGGGPYADTAAEFLALTMRLVAPGGVVGMVLPQSLLSSRDTASIRAQVDAVATLEWMWWSPTSVFPDAQVRTWAGVWRAGGSRSWVRRVEGPAFRAVPSAAAPAAGRWATLIGDGGLVPEGVDAPVDHGAPRLGSIATFSADFRQHYYGLVGAVADGGSGPPLITSGLIGPGRCLWGERPARYAKQRFASPRVDLDVLSAPMRRWALARLVPKILVANQTRTIEAVADPTGSWLPSVPVITCVSDDPVRVLAVLGSQSATRWVHAHAAGSGLGAGTVRLSPSLLASIPLAPS